MGLVDGDFLQATTFQLEDINPTRRFPLMVISILVLCGLSLFFVPAFDLTQILAFIPRRFFSSPAKESYTLISSIFVHADFPHFAGNMIYLYIFGDNIEDRIGRWKFGLVFLLLGAAASVSYGALAKLPATPTIGASGAVSGIMGAYLYLYPHAKMHLNRTFFFIPYAFEFPAWVFVGVWFVFLQLFGLATQLGNVAWVAHLAGLLFGYGLFFLLKRWDLL